MEESIEESPYPYGVHQESTLEKSPHVENIPYDEKKLNFFWPWYKY